MPKQKNLRFEQIRHGKPTGRVVAVVDPNTIDQRANKGIPFKRAQQFVATLDRSAKWERVGTKTATAEGNSTRVKQSAIRSRAEQANSERELRAHTANAQAIAAALKESK